MHRSGICEGKTIMKKLKIGVLLLFGLALTAFFASLVIVYARAEDGEGQLTLSLPENDMTDAGGLALYPGPVEVEISCENVTVGIARIEWKLSYAGANDVLASKTITPDEGEETVCNFRRSVLINETGNGLVFEARLTRLDGRVSVATKTFSIDTEPPVISASYSLGDYRNPSVKDLSHIAGFVRMPVKVTLRVDEVNFDRNRTKVKVSNSSGADTFMSNWERHKNEWGTYYTADIYYSSEGRMGFSVTAQDKAGNSSKETLTGEFVIDMTPPAAGLSFDNNEVQNGSFFQGPRTAELAIEDLHFDRSLVQIEAVGTSPDCEPISPLITWQDNTAYIEFKEDGDYRLDISAYDLAGNSADIQCAGAEAPWQFTIDSKIDQLQIIGTEDYSDGMSILISDAHLSDCHWKLLKTTKDNKAVDVTEAVLKRVEDPDTQRIELVGSFACIAANDGIYSIYVSCRDEAGNMKDIGETFTVNQFGSSFECCGGQWPDYFTQKEKMPYVTKITDDLLIREYNPSPPTEDVPEILILLDGRSLDTTLCKYTYLPPGEGSNNTYWYLTEYELPKELFSHEGVYRLQILSVDQAGNTNDTASFFEAVCKVAVDRTPPKITSITGLEKKTANAESVSVDYIVADSLGIKEISVFLNGEELDTITEFEDAANYSGSIVLTESDETQNIRFLVTDMAGNILDTDDENYSPVFAFNRCVVVSTDPWVRLRQHWLLIVSGASLTVASVAALWAIKRIRA